MTLSLAPVRRESRWHAQWKSDFASVGATVEQLHRRIDQQHRADIMLPSGTVLEVQRGWLSETEARQREASYVRLGWILDGTQLGARWWVGPWGAHIKQGPRWWASLRAPRWIDLGVDGVAEVHSLELVAHRRGARLLCKYRQTTRAQFVAWAIEAL